MADLSKLNIDIEYLVPSVQSKNCPGDVIPLNKESQIPIRKIILKIGIDLQEKLASRVKPSQLTISNTCKLKQPLSVSERLVK